MEKKLIASLILIALFIVFVGPMLILTAIIIGCITIYLKYPNQVSRIITPLITPLLIIGWLYYSYYFYLNNYNNKYEIRIIYYLQEKPNDYYTILATTTEEAYIEAWNYFMSENKKNIKRANDIDELLNASISIRNITKNRSIYPKDYDKMDSLIKAEKLYLKVGKSKIDLNDILARW